MANNKTIYQICLIFLFVIGIAYAQNYIEKNAPKKQEMVYFVPKKEHLVYTSFGFKSVLADMLWLRSISYFMVHLGGDNDFKYLFGMLDDSAALDPQFKQVYRDAMTMLLVDEGHYRDAEKLILLGIQNLPNDWEISYMAGMLYAYYLKDNEKALKYFDKCWEEIPNTKEFRIQYDNVNIMIRSLTEKKNDKKGLILYWINKWEFQHNKESKEFCLKQIKKYTSAFMEDTLNDTFSKKISDEEKNKIFAEILFQFQNFCEGSKLFKFMDAKNENFFVKVDAHQYPWVYSHKKGRFYSFGNARESLLRKINLYNVKLWEKLNKYLAISSTELLNYYPDEREYHVKLKSEFSEFPAFEEIYNEKDDWLSLEYPLFPIYDRKKGIFKVPDFVDLKTIDEKYK